MKKISILFSFILITVFSTGSFFIHRCYLKSYKKEFKSFVFENRKNTNYTTIKINPSELYSNSNKIIWEDENKEVVYKGILYDIVSIKTMGAHVELTVVSDEQEMELKKQFASLYDISSHDSTKKPFDLLKNFFALKYLATKTTLCVKVSESSQKTIHIYPSFQTSQGFTSQSNPPPDFCI